MVARQSLFGMASQSADHLQSSLALSSTVVPRFRWTNSVRCSVHSRRSTLSIVDRQVTQTPAFRALRSVSTVCSSDQLPSDKFGSDLLCMDQYKKLFGTCRIPAPTADRLHVYDKAGHRHVAVFFRNSVSERASTSSQSSCSFPGLPAAGVRRTRRETVSGEYLQSSEEARGIERSVE